MNDFMRYDFDIRKIVLALFMPAGAKFTTGVSITHRNRPSHGLALLASGENEYVFSDGKKLVVKENDIIYLPKHSTYTATTKTPGDCYAINFDIDENVTFAPFVVKAQNHSAITKHFRIADNIWKLKSHGYRMKCKAELYNIIYTIQQEHISEYLPQNKLKMIQPAIEYIHEKYTGERLSIDSLSKMCNITPEYFRKVFKSFYGVSPLIYINNLKISMAKELLKSQMYSVSDAALISGYSEMSHFSREFKKATGLCPSEYVKKQKGSKPG